MTATHYRTAFNEVFDEMRSSLSKLPSQGLLKEYSPWLDVFQQDKYQRTLEVPGNHYNVSQSDSI